MIDTNHKALVAKEETRAKDNPQSWKGAIVGISVAAVFVWVLATSFLRTGLGSVAEALAGLIFGAAVLAFFALLVSLVAAALARLPKRFAIALGACLGALIALKFTRYISFRWPDELFYPALVEFLAAQAVLGAAIAFLWSGDARHAPSAKKATAIGLIFLALLIDIGGFVWLAQPGYDPYPSAVETSGNEMSSAIDAPDPSQPGSHTVQTLFYGSGNNVRRSEFGADVDIRTETVDATLLLPEWKGFKARMREWYWGFGIEETPINGRVWCPEGEGPFPLVLIVHGNHGMEDYSDPGYAYLGELFASRGFITVSVDENLINGTWSGDFRGKEMPLRGWLLLEHLRVWRGWNARTDSPFYQKVDMENIALIGHSRGGEAVAIAAAFNRLSHFPDDANVSFDYHFSIKSLVAIAQIDRRYERRIELENVSFLALQGSYDSDEPSFHGMRQYARISYTDDHYRFKTGLLIHRANHGQFNTGWGRYDSGPPGKWLLNVKPLISGEDQRQIAKVYISAFLEATLHDKLEYLPVFRDYRNAGAWLPEGSYISRFRGSSFRPVADFEEDLDVSTASLQGSAIEAENLVVWRERDLPFRDKSLQHNNAVYLGWKHKTGDEGSAPPSYSITLPEHFAQEANLGPATVLSFALAHADERVKRPGEKNTEAREEESSRGTIEPIDLMLELVDAQGNIARCPFSRVASIPTPLRVQFVKLRKMNRQDYGDAWEPALQTYEVPLSIFTELSPQIDLPSLRTVRWRFDRSPTGVIILDDVGFSGTAPTVNRAASMP
jgi:hypothetical protein